LGAADGLEGGEAIFDLGGELGCGVGVVRVFGRGEGEPDVDAVAGWDSGDAGAGGLGVGRDGDVVDEAEVDDVAGDFGVVAVAESVADGLFSEGKGGHGVAGSMIAGGLGWEGVAMMILRYRLPATGHEAWGVSVG
jgi:hypothetical protein